MKIEKIIKPKDIPNLKEPCPECGNYTVYIHDLRCKICDNQTVLWCPACQEHFKVTFEE